MNTKANENRTFSHKDVVAALIKHADIKEGIWALYVEFGIAGINIQSQGPGEPETHPAAIVPIQRIGLQRVDKETPLSIDAAKLSNA